MSPIFSPPSYLPHSCPPSSASHATSILSRHRGASRARSTLSIALILPANQLHLSRALCHHFNVSNVGHLPPGQLIPATFDFPVVNNAHMPTHALAVVPSDNPTAPPLMIPIDVSLYTQGFRVELNISDPCPAPVLHTIGTPPTLSVTLPVVPLSVPHVQSLSLLLLFGLNLERHINLLAARLLPPQVVGEFPNAAAMAYKYSHFREDYFERYFYFTQGLWRNLLALGLKHVRVTELVQTAWNVSVDARKLRQRANQK